MEPSPDLQDTVSNPQVLDKYTQSGKIARQVLDEVIKACTPGASVADICALGDKRIEELVTEIFKGKITDKGIGFPTCISPNQICGYLSPLDFEEKIELKEGDVVKM